MAKVLDGKEVAAGLNEQMTADINRLKEQGVEPCLAILRVGDQPDNISYEKGATKRAEGLGIKVVHCTFDADIDQATLMDAVNKLNNDDSVHGVLMLNPIPEHLDWEEARMALAPRKDMDGITDGSHNTIYTGDGDGYPPCTAQACMEILKYYDIDPRGKKAVVIGRSLIIGKPVAMMLLQANATVTICHTKTEELPKEVQAGDIVIVAAGVPEFYDAKYFAEDQVVIDVGINWDEEAQKLVGDVEYASVEPIVGAITPVPGGVGSVTTAVLMSHIVDAAKKVVN